MDLKKPMKKKKGALGFNLIISFAIILAVAGVILTFTSQLNADIAEDLVENTTAHNVTVQVDETNYTMAKKMPLLAKLGIFFIVLAALLMIARPWMRG